MARWTESQKDIETLVNVSNQIPFGGIAEITLINGTILEGIIHRQSQGNNAGRDGKWAYYGELELETKDRQRWVIDFLEIKSARNVWNESKSKEYENLGLIEICEYPEV